MHGYTHVHDVDPADVTLQHYESGGEPRVVLHIGEPDTQGVSIYSTPETLTAVVDKLHAALHAADLLSQVTELRVIDRGGVLGRLRADDGERFSGADEFSAGYVDFERRKVLDDLERLGLHLVEVRPGGHGRGDRSFMAVGIDPGHVMDDADGQISSVVFHTLDGGGYEIEPESVVQHPGGGQVVTGKILRRIEPTENERAAGARLVLSSGTEPGQADIVARIEQALSDDPATPPDRGPEVYEGGTWRPAQPGEVAPFEDEGGITDGS